MKLSKFISNLQEYINQNPKSADLEVVYAADDEGNHFDTLQAYITPGCMRDGEWRCIESLAEEFINDKEYNGEDYTEEELESYQKSQFNSICIN